MSTFYERLKERLEALQLSERKAGMLAGLSPDTIRNFKRIPDQKPRAATLERLARLLQVDTEWLATGEGEPPPPPMMIPKRKRAIDLSLPTGSLGRGSSVAPVAGTDYDFPVGEGSPSPMEERAPVQARGSSITIPTGQIPEIDIRAEGSGYPVPMYVSRAGRAYHRNDAIVAHWAFPAPFLRDELRVLPECVDIVEIRGDSLTDESGRGLRDGDRVLVNRADRNVRQGGMFAIRDDRETIIKQAEVVRGSDPVRVICKSLNPRYQPFEVTLDGSAEIIGRVVLKISRM